MANIFDNKEGTGSDPRGFNPQVDNRAAKSNSGVLGKIMLYLSFLFIFPIFIYIGAKNSIMRLQVSINESASGIDIQLKRRRDTLIKLLDSTKGLMKYEKETFAEVIKMRTQGTSSPAQLNSSNQAISTGFSRFNAVMENYPELKSSQAVLELQETAREIELQISSTRRLYNANVREFNQRLFTYPTNVIAKNQNLTTIPFFEASVEDRKDVKMEF